MALARSVAGVDLLPGSQQDDAIHANMHSMSGRKANDHWQSCEQAFTDAQNQFQDDLNSGSRQDLAKALHMIQDASAPAHAGFQPWYGLPPSGQHMATDVWPGIIPLGSAFENSLRLLRDLRNKSVGDPAQYFPSDPCS
jgi:hypothetical protein